MPRPGIEVLEEQRVHPAKPHVTPTTTQLSVVDASVARFTPCGAIWYLDAPQNRKTLQVDALKASLERTLSAYPQWAGQLRMTPYMAGLRERKNSERYGRMEVRYGYDKDPGVAFVVAKVGCKMDDALPGYASKIVTGKWAGNEMMREDVLLPPTPLAGLNSLPSHTDPSVAVQITSFSCGGKSVAVQIAHPLADATALSRFVHDWNDTHTALCASAPPPDLNPIFAPSEVDRRSAESVDDVELNQKVLEDAYALPLHRYDWWISSENSGFGPNAHIIPEVLQEEQSAKEIAKSGTKMPWSTYNVRAPVSHTILHYTSAELDRIYSAATSFPNGGEAVNISRHDALVAHIWSLINRARGPENGEANSVVHADITFGLRTRVSPPLPSTFLGSPLQLAKVTIPWETAQSPAALPTMASAIKRILSQFTPEAIGAQIYAIAHELSPQRIWQAFLGREHMLVTSWVHTGLYECGFGTESPPRYVHPIMPLVDGCVQIMEAAPTNTQPGQRKWYDDGVDVAIYLETGAMEKLVRDEHVKL